MADLGVGTSWKINKTLAFAKALAAADAGTHPRIQRFVIPPFTACRDMATLLSGISVKVGAQNMQRADQGRGALDQRPDDQKGATILLAYEPARTIGESGIPATSDCADTRQAEIIATAQDVRGRKVPCLYNGSVNPDNCQDLIACPNIDGLFIGRSAWNVDGYLDIRRAAPPPFETRGR